MTVYGRFAVAADTRRSSVRCAPLGLTRGHDRPRRSRTPRPHRRRGRWRASELLQRILARRRCGFRCGSSSGVRVEPAGGRQRPCWGAVAAAGTGQVDTQDLIESCPNQRIAMHFLRHPTLDPPIFQAVLVGVVTHMVRLPLRHAHQSGIFRRIVISAREDQSGPDNVPTDVHDHRH